MPSILPERFASLTDSEIQAWDSCLGSSLVSGPSLMGLMNDRNTGKIGSGRCRAR